MSQTNVREGYRITTLEVVKLIEDFISYLAVAKYTQLRNAQILKVFYKAAVRQYSAKVKIENLSNTLTLTLSKTAQQQSSSIVFNRSTASITNKFSVALLTKLAILNDANVALVDAVHHSIVIDALTITLIKDDDDLLGTVNSHIKPPLKRRKTKAADSRYAKASGGRTKKDKDLEDSNTSSDILRLRRRDRAALGKEAQLKKTRDKEELAKAKKEKEEKEAQERETYLDINSKDDSEDEEATTAKDLAREQKERLKALLNAKQSLYKSGDSNRTLHSRRLTDAYILYFKELLSNNGGIFANAIGIGKTQAITEVQNARAEGNAIEYNAVNDNDKLCPTEGERTFYCADLLALQFCFFSNSLPENMGRPTKEEVIEMRIDTTNAISKALAAANKLVAPQSYVLGGVDHQETFVIVCGFRKVDKHVFRAYNTISVTAQRTIIRKGSPYIEKRAILLPSHVTFNATNKRDSVTSDRIYKIEDAVYYCLYPDFLSTVQNAKQQCRDILEKEGLNKSEASRRVIFNCFKMQAIASYPALATLKAAQFKTYSSCKVKRFTLNSVKDLFTNLSKDYFLVREARAITKSSLNIAAEDAAKAANTLLLLKEVRAKILIESYKLIVQAIIVALIAFAEAITLIEATHVVIIEPQDRQNTQDQFMFQVY
ncbi:hypothetical protein HBI71_245410 [Parastagonospora nodorum]|nr:hypothetical protein HBI71_245410 [Parastagonospora nodorum]